MYVNVVKCAFGSSDKMTFFQLFPFIFLTMKYETSFIHTNNSIEYSCKTHVSGKICCNLWVLHVPNKNIVLKLHSAQAKQTTISLKHTNDYELVVFIRRDTQPVSCNKKKTDKISRFKTKTMPYKYNTTDIDICCSVYYIISIEISQLIPEKDINRLILSLKKEVL